MSEYIVSARKYRPNTFDSVVGQTALTTTLKNSVRSGKLAHAYLFCGPRGVGKTTCARIFARAINCYNPSPDGEACGECESCRSFDENRSYNIFELDAASHSGVEDIKSLMEQTRIPPQIGKYKVFIIDEVHMLSSQAFNAFLKTLEEPPQHVIFILATTEKQKILPTILSRCQIYDFERMSVRDTINHLKKVAEQEGYTYEEEALAVIAEKADGGMRDALSIFDQAASFCQGDITYQKVIEDLNVLDSENYFRLIDLSLENKVADAMVLINQILSRGFDGGNMIQGLAKHVRNVMMARDPQTLPLLETSDEQRKKYQEQAQRCPDKFLYQALRIMNQCDVEYRQSSNKRLLVELTIIEIAQITQEDGDANSAGRRPAKRLKPLFRLLQPTMMQNTTAVPQGNAAAPKVAKNNDATTQTVKNDSLGGGGKTDNTPVTNVKVANSIPKLKLGNTFKSVKQQSDTAVITATEEVKEEENEPFTISELSFQWMAMCNRMPKEYVASARRMKNINPVITDFPNIEVVAENDNIMSLIKGIEGRIQSTLRKTLHNSNIHFTIRLAKQEERKQVLSKKEQFAEVKEQNPSLDKLCQLLDLELI